jgi:hypothetical protein
VLYPYPDSFPNTEDVVTGSDGISPCRERAKRIPFIFSNAIENQKL